MKKGERKKVWERGMGSMGNRYLDKQYRYCIYRQNSVENISLYNCIVTS